MNFQIIFIFNNLAAIQNVKEKKVKFVPFMEDTPSLLTQS